MFALRKLIMIANINKLVYKVYIVSKKTGIIGYKFMTSITKLLQKIYSDLLRLYDPAFIENNCYFIIIINNNIKKM